MPATKNCLDLPVEKVWRRYGQKVQHADIVTKAVDRESLRNTAICNVGDISLCRKMFRVVANIFRVLLVDPAPGMVFAIACLNEQRNTRWLRRITRRDIAEYYCMGMSRGTFLKVLIDCS